jgi:hypothetical protein
MMMVEYLARTEQSKFKADIRNLIKRERPEFAGDIGELHKMPKKDLVKDNEEIDKGHKEILDDFIESLTYKGNFQKFVNIIHEIDNDTLAAIFYAMPTHKKRKLSNKLRDRIEIEDLDENIKVGLRRIRQILIESIRYDTEAALVHRKPKTTSVEETGRMI